MLDFEDRDLRASTTPAGTASVAIMIDLAITFVARGDGGRGQWIPNES